MGKRTKTHIVDAPVESDDVSLNLSGVTNFFKGFDASKLLLIGFILFALALVWSVRVLPAALPVTHDWADQTVRGNIRAQMQQQIDSQFPALPQENKDKLINERTDAFIVQNQQEFDGAKDQLSEQFKTFLQYTGDDGKQYTYVGDLDSYFWLRYARNYLTKGHTCDAVVNGECRDNYPLAPVGVSSSYNPSLHVFAIAYLYKFMTIFNPQYPLPATTFLVQAILGTLCVIPAFFIGRRLAGNVGGVFAALLTSLHPLFLSRSLGSDNDAWNLLMPLFVMWMAIEALDAKNTKQRIIYSVLTGLMIGIHAAAWEGWWFIYLIIFFAMIGLTIFRVAESARRKEKFWQNIGVRNAALILGVFYVSAFIFTTLMGKLGAVGYFRLPLLTASTTTSLNRAVVSDYWPNVLTTVAELNKSSFSEAVNTMGGPVFFLGCLLGLLLLILPRKKWEWEHYGILAVGLLISIYLVATSGHSKLVTLMLLALPIGLTFLLYLVRGVDDTEMHLGAALVVLVWFLASVYATYSGVRFILLMIPAFGVAFAVAAGRIYEWVSSFARKEIDWHPYIVNTLVFLIIILALVQPVKSGYYTARGFVPTIDDAWWDTLTKINLESQPDAIINSWWDFGHWFKYVADRRVSADGTTQHTHVPHWLGLALVTDNERESMGILRMLDCGSDAFPAEEGNLGAYGQVLKKVADPLEAESIVVTLVQKDEPAARKFLADKGFTKEEQDAVLARTHCNAPEDYFITSGDMVGKAGVWAHFGLWNFSKAYIAQKAKTTTRNDAVPDFMQRFGYSEERADELYFEAKALATEGDVNSYAAPWPGYITPDWHSCQDVANASALVCPLGLGISNSQNGVTAIDAIVYNRTNPNASYVVFGFYQNGRRMGQTNGTAQELVVAGQSGLTTYTYEKAMTGNLAVLIDDPGKRVLIVDPTLIKSMFTQLYYLDGRYLQYFDKFDDRQSISGSRILTWKVDWDGKNTSSSSSSSKVVIGKP